jgi:hypothetical protein
VLPYHPTCLPRALVTTALLRNAGINASLRIGVRRDGEAVHAHAWTEVSGVPVDVSVMTSSGFSPIDGALGEYYSGAVR